MTVFSMKLVAHVMAAVRYLVPYVAMVKKSARIVTDMVVGIVAVVAVEVLCNVVGAMVPVRHVIMKS